MAKAEVEFLWPPSSAAMEKADVKAAQPHGYLWGHHNMHSWPSINPLSLQTYNGWTPIEIGNRGVRRKMRWGEESSISHWHLLTQEHTLRLPVSFVIGYKRDGWGIEGLAQTTVITKNLLQWTIMV